MKIDKEIGNSTQNIGLKSVKELGDTIKRFPVWNIHRFESKEHYKIAKREERRIMEEFLSNGVTPSKALSVPFYDKKEAIDLFGVPEITQIKGNLLLDEGINEMWTLVAGTGGAKFDSSTYIGVGDSLVTEDSSQTDLQAETNKVYVEVDDGYPTYGTNQLATWCSTFTENVANFDWNEYTLANGSDGDGINLCRKVSAQGTKVVDQIWELTYIITLA